MNLDHRASILLKTLIERYSVEGQPVGSKTLSQYSGLDVSPATIRNVMAELEDQGYITSPHTSSGRIPTTLGYRLFIDRMLTADELDDSSRHILESRFQDTLLIPPQEIITQASSILSGLTHFAGVVKIPQLSDKKVQQIEFVKLSDTKILIILVTTDGTVQNRIFNATENYPQDSLNAAANYFNQHYHGLDFSMMSDYLRQEIRQLRQDIAALMQATLKLVPEQSTDTDHAYVMSGHKNLLDFSSNINTMQKLFDFFDQKTALAKILDDAKAAEGVQIYIGGESDSELLEGISMVIASYHIEGQIVGTLGVLGPTRMNYEKVIPIVDITAKLLSSTLSKS